MMNFIYIYSVLGGFDGCLILILILIENEIGIEIDKGEGMADI